MALAIRARIVDERAQASRPPCLRGGRGPFGGVVQALAASLPVLAWTMRKQSEQ